jgi:hypothetical protein
MKKFIAVIVVMLLIFSLGCSSLQRAGNATNQEESVEVAVVTLGSYLIANRLMAASMGHPAPAPKP